MPRRLTRWSIVIGLVVAWAAVANAQNLRVLDRARPGVWSSAGKYLWPGPAIFADMPLGGRNIVVASPNAVITARVTDRELTLMDHDNPSRFTQTAVPVASLAEILWAQDSSAFALTQSNSSWFGTWSVTIYRLGPTGLNESDPGRLAIADFKLLFPRCPDKSPNVAAVDWLDGSRRLRLLVEMPCVVSCTDMCQVAGYVVDISGGAILDRLPGAMVHREWKTAIGTRFRPE